MRYSMLAYIVKMSRMLLEAAQYLRTAPEDGLRAELLGNGRQMLEQIRAVLEGHRDDLHSNAPLTQLAEIEAVWKDFGRALEGRLEQFAQELPEQVIYQVRAVFFAELGEKWDAMESVYEYMRCDPRFDPVIVRTPVGRVVMDEGGRRQEIIYKDFFTPMGITSLGYDQYDIEEDCPELAFISQPYESAALEQFWPENIAKHTRLVYLPYFAPFSIYESAQEVLCEMPVYRYAWKTIGSSERHYRYYCKYAANGGANMLVTGVPKWDPVVALRTNPVAVPKAWKEAVTGRKVFLWNSFYQFDGSSLPYFDTIYQWFQAHPDCALIWRAHPMTDTVTKLYYPQCYLRLQECIALVEAAPNMVCDREPSYNAAFSCSIAQISDLSSMMFQYLLLDKPVLYIKTCGRGKVEQEFFIDSCWMEQAECALEIQSFLDDVYQGVDKTSKLRELVRNRDIPLADGQCGKRVCETLWEQLHKEDAVNADRTK